MTKGRRALVEGRLQIRSYDGNYGKKHYATEVVCERFEFVDSKQNSNNSQGFNEMGTAVPFDENIPF